MEIVKLNNSNEYVFPKLSVTIGAYDGIHYGHIAVIKELIKDKECKKAVITFDVHPDFSLNKCSNYGVINTIEEKAEIFSEYGIDYLIVLEKDILAKTWLEFNLFLKKINCYRVVVGSDFCYGYQKEGNIETLKKDFIVDVAKTVTYNNTKLSSTDLRLLLKNGNIEEVNKLMKEKFQIEGVVSKGSNIGEKLGFKTANLEIGDKFFYLRKGVYEVLVKFENKVYFGIANFGFNPTLNKIDKPRLEVHILDFSSDIYNRTIEVIFIRFIRDEKVFSSKEELIEQISNDIKTINKDKFIKE